MALSANSYGTVAEVETLVRHLAGDGFTLNTTPQLSEIETIIDRVSGVLNTALSSAGFTVPVTNANATLACDEWVIKWTMRELRYAYPHLGIGEEESLPQGDMFESARMFAVMNLAAFTTLGETVVSTSSQGLNFTGLYHRSERSDPTNTSYEQPMFRRGQFDSK